MTHSFIPGSEWLYFKLYTGTRTADRILVDYLRPFLQEIYDKAFIDYYFFIRYADPEYHLRLRLHIIQVHNIGEILGRFSQCVQPLVDSGLIWNVQCDTYKREMKRYGAERIMDIESLFGVDSEAIISLLSLLHISDNAEFDRWNLALLLMDDILNGFNLCLLEKSTLSSALNDNFLNEFGFTKRDYTSQLNDKYRHHRQTIEQTMERTNNIQTIYGEILEKRVSQYRHIVNNMNMPEVGHERDVLIGHIMHMTMNRLFRSKNRICELVINMFLHRHYKSKLHYPNGT